MKWKLTFRFVATIISVVIIVVLINSVAIIMTILNSNRNGQENKSISGHNMENFVRDFSGYILAEGEEIYVNNQGKKALDSKETWIQILNEDGGEVYQYKRPDNIPAKYTPFHIVHGYKYEGGIGEASTIFMGKKEVEDRFYSYIIGISMQKVRREVITYNTNELGIFLKNIILIVLIIDSVIALFFGYLFSRGITKPLGNIITGVGRLGKGEYDVYYTPKGVYRDIYNNLNDLSNILKSNRKERKKLNKMRDEWIANISHDIKTPLASIKGYAEILSDDDYDFSKEEVKSYAAIIDDKSNYIRKLVDDLNLTTKLKNNISTTNNKNEVNIVKLVRETIIDILNDPIYNDSNIDFIAKEDIILDKVDETLMRRAISNLLYNALIHNDSNVKIEVKIIKDDRIHIFIKDNGKGILPDELKYIFDRYYRGTNTGEEHKGSGLGMAIAKDIVKAQGGDIKISSIINKGTEIEIIL
ncbi:HAMP domain-containing sensor histidine kinase [Vallitalea sediminicola]